MNVLTLYTHSRITVFSRIDERRWRRRRRPWPDVESKNGQKKRITDNTTVSRHRRPTLLSMTRVISPLMRFIEDNEQPLPVSVSFFPITDKRKEFCVTDANQFLFFLFFFYLSLLVLSFFFSLLHEIVFGIYDVVKEHNDLSFAS